MLSFHTSHTSKLWLFALVVIAIASCASKRAFPPGQLQTRITEGGLKLFELTFPAQPRVMPKPGSRTPPEELTSRRMQSMLDEVIATSQYCRDGYVLLGRYAGETVQRLRGECRDRATEEDRQKFPDSIARW